MHSTTRPKEKTIKTSQASLESPLLSLSLSLPLSPSLSLPPFSRERRTSALRGASAAPERVLLAEARVEVEEVHGGGGGARKAEVSGN